MSDQNDEKKMHVDKLTIHAEQVFLGEPRRRREDPLLFGPRRNEVSENVNEEKEEKEAARKRYDPFLNDSVFRPMTSGKVDEAGKKMKDDHTSENERGNEINAESGQSEASEPPRRPFWLR